MFDDEMFRLMEEEEALLRQLVDAEIKKKNGGHAEYESHWAISKEGRFANEDESRLSGRSVNGKESHLVDHDDPRANHKEGASSNEKQARHSDHVELNNMKPEIFTNGNRWPKSDEEPWPIKGEVPVWEEDIHDDQSGLVYLPRLSSPHRLDEFSHHHHLTRSQVEGLLRVLGPHYTNPARRAPLKNFVLSSLVVLATKNNYRELSESKLFNSRGWMHKTLHQFCKMMVKHLSSMIEWPTGSEALQTVAQFEAMAGFPGVVGALDTEHLPLTKAPVGQSSKLYTNARLFNSIQLMAVADARSVFTYVNVGRPGSLSEAKVLENSSLKEVVCSTSRTPMLPSGCHLIADSSFPLTENLLTPFPQENDATDHEHLVYNDKLMHTRAAISTAFATLRFRWQRLNCLEMDEVDSMVTLIKCCCILHNVCALNDGYMCSVAHIDRGEDDVPYAGSVGDAARNKRQLLAASGRYGN